MRRETPFEEFTRGSRVFRTVVAGLIACTLMSGCVTTRTMDMTPEQLREDIRSGELVKSGDHVSVVTATIGERVFRVTEVDQDVIRGEGIEVAIDDVVSLQTREVHAGKTALAVGGTLVGISGLFWVAVLAVALR